MNVARAAEGESDFANEWKFGTTLATQTHTRARARALYRKFHCAILCNLPIEVKIPKCESSPGCCYQEMLCLKYSVSESLCIAVSVKISFFVRQRHVFRAVFRGRRTTSEAVAKS